MIDELNLYDHYWQRSPIEAPDSNIVIVGIDEADLNKVNWPITNDNLANLILNIEEQKPAMIGLVKRRVGKIVIILL